MSPVQLVILMACVLLSTAFIPMGPKFGLRTAPGTLFGNFPLFSPLPSPSRYPVLNVSSHVITSKMLKDEGMGMIGWWSFILVYISI